MAELIIELSGSTWREPWTRSTTVSAAEATKVAEWLKKIMPDLIAQEKAGEFPRFDVHVKD